MLSEPLDDVMLRDILDQPDALSETLAALATQAVAARITGLAAGAGRVVFSGMGASYHACYPALQRLLAAGRPAAWVEAGELLHFMPALAGPGSLLVLVSQSGRTAEIVHLLECHPAHGPVVAVTNDPDSPLARSAGAVLALGAGEERAVCSTKTYTCTLLALDLLADALLGEQVAVRRWPAGIAALRHGLESRAAWLPPLTDALAVPEHLWLLARGPAVSAAITGALIIKESSRVHAEGMSAPQFRHGPLEGSLPGRSALVMVTPGALGDLDLDLASEMARAGMTVAAVSTEPGRDLPNALLPVRLPPVPPGLEALAQILPAQLLGRAFVLAQGRTPGQFSLIGKVTVRE